MPQNVTIPKPLTSGATDFPNAPQSGASDDLPAGYSRTPQAPADDLPPGYSRAQAIAPPPGTPSLASAPGAPPPKGTLPAPVDQSRQPGGVFGPAGAQEQGFGTNKEQAVRAAKDVGSAAADVAPVMTFGASLPVQAGVSAASSGLGTKLAGGTNLQTLRNAAIGGAVPVAAEYLPAARRAWMPTLAEAGAKFAPVEAAAAKVPINTAPARALTEQASEYGQAGSTVPKVLRNFMSRTNPQTGFPLPEGAESTPQVLYPEGRKFAENAGRLSAQEVMESNPQMQRLTAQFAEALKTANRDAAAKVGMADAYDDAMQSYRGASRRAELIQNAKDVAQKYILHAAATGAGLGAGYDIYHRLVK